MPELLARSEYCGQMVDVFKESEGLSSLGAQVREAPEGLTIKVKGGVPLKGSWVARQEAEPRFE